jgi:hypothetical protein
MDGLIVFSGDNAHPLSSLLRPACRHVWCAIRDKNGIWIETNMSLTGINTTAIDKDFDLRMYYQQAGLEAWVVDAQPANRGLMPYNLNSCVGLTKALTGIRHPAFTPYQLRGYLARKDAKCTYSNAD